MMGVMLKNKIENKKSFLKRKTEKLLKSNESILRKIIDLIGEKINIAVAHIYFRGMKPPFLIVIEEKYFVEDLLKLFFSENEAALILNKNSKGIDYKSCREIEERCEKMLLKMLKRELFLREATKKYQLILKHKKTRKEVPIALFKNG